ncbi:MAG: hypothetical protein JO138_08630 [Acidobacteriaceae bacterium]|nr:hypothetical protein [Acidobacteriaceae bacterium]
MARPHPSQSGKEQSALLSDDTRRIDRATPAIDNFRGDYANLAALIQKSWSENNRQPLLYTPDFLKSLFEYPEASFSLAPTLYTGTNPIAFSAGLPRRMRFRGRDIRVVTSTLLTVSPESKKHGYGIVLWSELVKRARAAGFDGMLNFCIDGEPMNGMIVGCARRLNLPIERIFSAHYSSVLLRPAGSREPTPDSDNGSVEELLRLAAPLSDSVPLGRLWSAEEAQWQCMHRAGAITARHTAGSRSGMLTGYVMEVDRPDRAQCLLVEDVLWGTLTADERLYLLRKLLHRAAASGVRMATVPDLHYADMQPFTVAGFRSSKRILHAYLTIWNGDALTEPLPSIYLDVF